MAARDFDLGAARTAIRDLIPEVTRVIRGSGHEGPVLGHWGTGEVASHLCDVIRLDTDAIAGRPLPPAELNPKAVAVLTDAELAADPERDHGVLAEHAEALLDDFLAASEAPAGEQVTWLGGVRIPASAVACHLVEELLVHSHDMAAPTGLPWTIEPAHAALAIGGAAVPIVNASPRSFVHPKRAQGLRARCDVRLRGHDRFTFVLDGGLTAVRGDDGPVDAHVSVDPGAMLLLMLGRIGVARPFLTGKALVWGRRPWKLPQMLGVISPP